MKNILLSVVVIAMLVAGGVGGTLAGWQDEEYGEYCFTAGSLDLQIDLNGEVFEPFSDDLQNPRDIICEDGLEPGDSGNVSVSMHVISDPAGEGYYTLVTVDVSSLQDCDNGPAGPEVQAGDNTTGIPGADEGELDDFLMITLSWDEDCNGTPDTLIVGPVTYASLVSGAPITLCLFSCENCCVIVEWELAGYGSAQSPDSEVNLCMTDSLGGRVTFTALGPEYGCCPQGTYCCPHPDQG